MDVVSSASGVFATVTIAFQLGQGVRKLLEFWSNVQRAPDRIAAIFDDLSLLSSVLHRVEKNSHVDPITTRALLNCRSKIQTLEERIDRSGRHLVSSNGWKKKWSELNITLKDKEINELREAITNAHRLLMGLQITTIEHQTQQILLSLQSSNPSAWLRSTPQNEVKVDFARNNVEENAPPAAVQTARFLMQRSSVRPRSCKIGQKDLRAEKNYFIHPPEFLNRLGVSYGIDLHVRSTGAWQVSLNVFRAVPKSAPIFQYCREGDISAVRCLLANGYASPWDRDPSGMTPLHVAASSLHLDIAELLLREGADSQVKDGRHNRLPIDTVQISTGDEIAPKLAMIRLLQKYCGDGYDGAHMLIFTASMLFRYRAHKKISLPLAERWDAAQSIIEYLAPEFEEHDFHRTALLEAAIHWYFDRNAIRWLLRMIPGHLSQPGGDYSAVHAIIYRRLLERDPESARAIVQKTPDLHRYCNTHSVGYQTPTSLAMFQSGLFIAWRDLLLDLNHDISAFVENELKQAMLASQGWNKDNLTNLFKVDFAPSEGPRHFGFPNCERCGASPTGVSSETPVDIEWRRLLRSIRCGHIKEYRQDHSIEGLGPNGSRQPGCAPLHKDENSQGLTPRDWPYRMVCYSKCKDGICTSQLYENDDMNEPVLPMYTDPDISQTKIQELETPASSEAGTTHSEIVEDPSLSMPGAFPQ